MHRLTCTSLLTLVIKVQLSHNVRKPTFGHVRPAKIRISLRICAVWSESSLDAFWIAKNTKFLHGNNEDADQTARTRRLIRVFVGCTCQKVHFLTLLLNYTLMSFFIHNSTQFDLWQTVPQYRPTNQQVWKYIAYNIMSYDLADLAINLGVCRGPCNKTKSCHISHVSSYDEAI